MLACFSCLPKTSVGMSSKANQQSPRAPARVTDGVSLFPEGPGGTSYLESALKDVFGEYSGEVIDDLFVFKKNLQGKQDRSESENSLLTFLDTLAFLGRWGDLHLQQKDGTSEYTIDFCNQIAFLIQHYSNPKDTQALIAQIAKKNSFRILRNTSLASVLVVGVIAAVGLLGCQFTLPLAVYISLGALAFSAVAGSQFAYYTAQRPCVALWQKLMTDTLSEKLTLAVQTNDADTCRILLEPFRHEHSLFPRIHGHLSPKTKPVIKSLWKCFLKIWFEAAKKGNLAVCQAFIEAGAPLNGPLLEYSRNLLSIALEQKNRDLCKILLAAGAGRFISPHPLQSPTIDKELWQKAMKGRDPIICQAFIQTGLVDVNAVNGAGRTPLADALYQRDGDLCKILLAAGAGRIPNPKLGQPPILDPSLWWKALESYSLNVCQAFIDSGLVDVNAPDRNGRPPLYNALFVNLTTNLAKAFGVPSLVNTALAKVLLAAGADMNALMPTGLPCQHIDAQGEIAHGLAVARPFWQEAVLQGRFEACYALLEAAKDPNVKLLLAAYCRHTPYFAEALLVGADKGFIDQCLTEPAFVFTKGRIEEFLKQVDAKHLEIVQKEFTDAVDVLPVDSARVVFDYAVWPVLKDQRIQPPE